MSKHYISCARCDKDIEITISSDCHSSDIDGQLLCYDCWQKEQPKYLADQVADLEAKLAEKDVELERIREINLYNKDLAETSLKQLIDAHKELVGRQRLCDLRYKQLQDAHQDKISFCIEQLEKVKEFAEKEIRECNKLLQEESEDDYYIQSINARQSMCYEFKREIDNQIKQLNASISMLLEDKDNDNGLGN